MLVVAFALLVLASGVGFWRVVARNQFAARYLQEATLDEGLRLESNQLSPEKWAVVEPLQTLQSVVRAEIGALRVGRRSALAASMVVNTEVAHWLAHQAKAKLAAEDAQILEALAQQIRALWQEGHWGCSGSLDKATLLEALDAMERSLVTAGSQVAAGHSPYR